MSISAKNTSENILKKYNVSNFADSSRYRQLNTEEILSLKSNRNNCKNWSSIFVTDNFDPDLIKDTTFWGEVYIGNLTETFLSDEDLHLAAGIYNSTIISSIIGDDVAIKNVSYLANYKIGNNCIICNTDQISCSTNATFGNGYIYKNSDNVERNWLEIANENGGRKILPFEDILPADAYFWSQFRDDDDLQDKFMVMTDELVSTKKEIIGKIDDNTIIKNCTALVDAKIGSFCKIEGVGTLKNITVLSNGDEPTFIGTDSDIKNSIIGFGNKIFYGPKCINIVTGRNVKIELGARVLHSFISDNSTVACCEVLSNLIFPLHEQHHNNSFLIATTVQGQSNIGAGATIGSNHNSRAADGEIIAGRGFWPGLSSSFKHNSIFASFSLIAKGSYESEMNIKLPFSLISNNTNGQLQIFPAFWFRYNMFALARNSWKFHNRDKRRVKAQNIEMDYLAPDSALEMLEGIRLIKQAIIESKQTIPDIDEKSYDKKSELAGITISDVLPKEKAILIKPVQALWLYHIMISYYAGKEIAAYLLDKPKESINELLSGSYKTSNWLNFGGQLIEEKDIISLVTEIKSNKVNTWHKLHERYNELWSKYPKQRLETAVYCWLEKDNKDANDLSLPNIKNLLAHSVEINKQLLEWTIEARSKDYSNPFRQMVYRNQQEMNAVLGEVENNSFIKEMKKQHEQYSANVNTILTSL